MDHLPDITGAVSPIPKIEYLGHLVQYDGLGFLDFPARAGWLAEYGLRRRNIRPQRMDGETEKPRELEALLQAWFIFGVIGDMIKLLNPLVGRLKYSIEDFITEKDPDTQVRYISMLPLVHILNSTCPSIAKDEPSHESRNLFLGLSKLTTQIQNAFEWIFRDPCDWHREVPFDSCIAIPILGETFTLMLQAVMTHRDPSVHPIAIAPAALMHGLRERFLEAGWCPWEVGMIERHISGRVASLYMAARAPRPFSTKTLDHSKCSADICRELQLDRRTYQVRHTPDCTDPSRCTSCSIDGGLIAELIENGQTPVIRVTQLGHGRAEVEIMPEQRAFLAISHVWGHGRGNPRENALPSCQLLAIKAAVQSAARSAGIANTDVFWMDTLCIPVGSQYRPTRRKAISQIASIFSRATRVVVMDADLEQTIAPRGVTDFALRFLSTGWMQRLWTLNEAVVAGDVFNTERLSIRFLNGTMAFDELYRRRSLALFHPETTLRLHFPRATMAGMDSLETLFQTPSFRSTSEVGDEPLCIASILNLDIASISAFDTAEDRMAHLYLSLGSLPTRILFHSEPHLSIPGMGWAPKTFLLGGLEYDAIRFDMHLKHFTTMSAIRPSGELLVDLPGYILKHADGSAPSPNAIRSFVPSMPLDPRVYDQISSYSSDTRDFEEFKTFQIVASSHSISKKTESQLIEELCQHFLTTRNLGLITLEIGYPFTAFLVEIMSRDEEHIFCVKLARVEVIVGTDSVDEAQSCGQLLIAERKPEKVRWCVG